MIYSQYKAAVVDGYLDRPAEEIRQQIKHAAACRDWLESLDIAPAVRDVVVEQIHVIGEAFEEILRDPRRTSTTRH